MINPSRRLVYALLPLLFIAGLAAFPRSALAAIYYYTDAYHGSEAEGHVITASAGDSTISGHSIAATYAFAIGRIVSVDGSNNISAASLNSGYLGGQTINLDTEMIGKPDGEYIFAGTSGSSSPFYYIIFELTGGVVSILGDGSIPIGSISGDTSIFSVDPEQGQIISTSSLPYDFTTIGNINSADWKDGVRLRIKIDRNTDQQSTSALVGFDSAFGNYTYLGIPVESGPFVLSTTSLNSLLPNDRIGLYTMHQEIQVPGIGVHWWLLNFDLTWNTLAATTTQFTVGTTTDLDNIAVAQTNYLNSIATSTNGSALSDCQFSWFNSAIDFSLGSKLFRCMAGVTSFMFIPSPGSIQATFDEVRGGILTRAPWGYATRLASILSSNATSTLPTFTAGIYLTGTSTPDTTLTFDPGDMLDGGAALLNGIHANGTSLSLRDIVEPWIEMFIALSIVFIIAIDVLHIRKR